MPLPKSLHSIFQVIDPFLGAVHSFEAGDPENDTIVLLHGYMSHGLMFSRTIDLLAKDYHLVMPELPGHGLDESFRDGGVDTTIEANIGWLRHVVEEIQPAHIIGHSLGGSLAYEVAKEFPFESVMLVGPGLHIPTKKIQRMAVERLPSRFAKLIAKRPVFRVFEKLQWEGEKMNAHEVDRYVRPLKDPDRLEYMVKLAGDLLEHAADPRHVRPLKMKTKILWGEKDAVIPVSLAPRLAEAMHADLEILEFSGHSPPEDEPELFAQSVREFLER